MDQTQLKAAARYFETPEMLKAFALGCLDGTQRQEILGITQRHYKDQALASSWYRATRADIARCRSRLSKAEYSRINNIVGKIFTDMTKHGSAAVRLPPNFHGTTQGLREQHDKGTTTRSGSGRTRGVQGPAT